MRKTCAKALLLLLAAALILCGCAEAPNESSAPEVSESSAESSETSSASEVSDESEVSEDEVSKDTRPHPAGTAIDTEGALKLVASIEPDGNTECVSLRKGDGFLLCTVGYDDSECSLRVYDINADGSGLTLAAELAKGSTVYSNTIRLFDDGILGFYSYEAKGFLFYDENYKLVSKAETPESVLPLYTHFTSDRKFFYYIDEKSNRLYRQDSASGEKAEIALDDALTDISLNGLYNGDSVLCISALDQYAGAQRLVFISAETGETLYASGGTFYGMFESDGHGLFISDVQGVKRFCLWDKENPSYVGEILGTGLSATYDFKVDDECESITYTYYDDKADCTRLKSLSLTDGSENASTSITIDDDADYFISTTGAAIYENIVCIPVTVYDDIDNEYESTVKSFDIFMWDTSIKGDASGLELPPSDVVISKRPEKDDSIPEELDEKRSRLEDDYGIEIYVGNECNRYFGDYDVSVVTDADTIESAVDEIEEAFSYYPKNFFPQLKYGKMKRIALYLCGELKSTSAYSLSYAGAFAWQYGDEQMFVFDITATGTIKQTFFHEISHAIDKKLLDDPDSGFDDWEWCELNPEGFNYSYDYNSYTSLSDKNTVYGLTSRQTSDDIYFIDTYAKTYPTEDRARLMEYLMGSEDISYFDGKNLQKKLEYYFDAMRRSFDTTDWGVTSWEQLMLDVQQGEAA